MSAHSWLSSIAFVCLLINRWLGIWRKAPPYKTMESVHENTGMCTLEFHIQTLTLMESISIFPFWNWWRILPFKTKSSRIQAMKNALLRCVVMHWREIFQTRKFATQNKLCFDNIVLPMCYKVHARQPFWIAIPRMTRAQSSCALQRSKMSRKLCCVN